MKRSDNFESENGTYKGWVENKIRYKEYRPKYHITAPRTRKLIVGHEYLEVHGVKELKELRKLLNDLIIDAEKKDRERKRKPVVTTQERDRFADLDF